MLLLLFACAHHIPDPGPPPSRLPVPQATLRVCAVETATGRLPRRLAVAHGALDADVVSTTGGVLLIHPSGTWLVDGGLAAEFEDHMADVPGFVGYAMRRSAADWTVRKPLAEAITALGVDPATLGGMFPTHGHYDHLGGLLDLPGVPLWMPEEEIAEAKRAVAGEPSGILPAEATLALSRASPMPLTLSEVGPWGRSWDLFGDGSALVVAMPGHTPGSVGVLLHVADGRLLLVGDTVWAREGYELREPKSWIAGSFDADGDATDRQIQLLHQIHRSEPDVTILPAHDRRQWEKAFPEGCR